MHLDEFFQQVYLSVSTVVRHLTASVFAAVSILERRRIAPFDDPEEIKTFREAAKDWLVRNRDAGNLLADKLEICPLRVILQNKPLYDSSSASANRLISGRNSIDALVEPLRLAWVHASGRGEFWIYSDSEKSQAELRKYDLAHSEPRTELCLPSSHYATLLDLHVSSPDQFKHPREMNYQVLDRPVENVNGNAEEIRPSILASCTLEGKLTGFVFDGPARYIRQVEGSAIRRFLADVQSLLTRNSQYKRIQLFVPERT